MFDGQLLWGTLMIAATVVLHVAGLVFLASLLIRWDQHKTVTESRIHVMGLLVLAVLFIIGIHTVEAYGWAALYYYLGEFTDLKQALYFSVVTATTLGYGDITLSERWQLLGTFEAMGGLILFGASTAFLLGLMRSLFEQTANPKDSKNKT